MAQSASVTSIPAIRARDRAVGSHRVAFRFTVLEGDAAHFARNMLLALAAAVLSARARLAWARGLGSVKRRFRIVG